MQAEAIAKLKNEMDSNKNHPYVQVIGQFLIKHIQENQDDAEKIMTADKTIVKSLEAMKAEAQKKQHNGMAMLTDEEGFKIVLAYFGITVKPVVANAVPVPALMASAPSVQKPVSPVASFDVKLDDFL